jgi:hypothetical protein
MKKKRNSTLIIDNPGYCTYIINSNVFLILNFSGVFWIDYDSLCRFFDVIYINWNPELFKYTTCTHR